MRHPPSSPATNRRHREKGILPAMVPMDNYLYDLNSGQSYYRPSYLLVLVLKQDRLPLT